jgi:hypothetical protein
LLQGIYKLLGVVFLAAENGVDTVLMGGAFQFGGVFTPIAWLSAMLSSKVTTLAWPVYRSVRQAAVPPK